MKRQLARKKKDRRIFRQTARKVKSINASPKIYRGGIRL